MFALCCNRSLDTGRLNPETYRLFDKVEKHYKIRIEYTFPDSKEVMDLMRNKGCFSFYEDGHQECCRVRKVRSAVADALCIAWYGLYCICRYHHELAQCFGEACSP